MRRTYDEEMNKTFTHILLNLNKSSHVNGRNVVISACCSGSFHPEAENRHPVTLKGKRKTRCAPCWIGGIIMCIYISSAWFQGVECNLTAPNLKFTELSLYLSFSISCSFTLFTPLLSFHITRFHAFPFRWKPCISRHVCDKLKCWEKILPHSYLK